MAEFMQLVGVEEMQRAANRMQSAANDMQAAANQIDATLERAYQRANELIDRLEVLRDDAG